MPRQTAEYRPKKLKEIPINPGLYPTIRAFHKIWYPMGCNCEICREQTKAN